MKLLVSLKLGTCFMKFTIDVTTARWRAVLVYYVIDRCRHLTVFLQCRDHAGRHLGSAYSRSKREQEFKLHMRTCCCCCSCATATRYHVGTYFAIIGAALNMFSSLCVIRVFSHYLCNFSHALGTSTVIQ